MFKKFIITYDHRVDKKYILKIKQILDEHKVSYVSVDDNGAENDYPLLAKRAHELYKENKADGMILLCGTGIGMNMVANKFAGIRSVLANSEAEAYFSRRHEDANTIVFAAGYNDGINEIKLCRRRMGRMLETFLTTEFEGDRHIRRLKQMAEIEAEEGKNGKRRG